MQSMWARGIRSAGAGVLSAWLLSLGGCTTTSLVLSAAGVATDTSITWEIVKHLHAKATEGDDLPCRKLDTVQRALNVRCGPVVAGSVVAADLQRTTLQSCPLGVAASDARLWPALPEFIGKGARPESCAASPLLELAEAPGCPDFSSASPAVLGAIRQLAETDSRAIHHDIVRMLSCPSAVAVGLDSVLATWLARGDLNVGRVSFGPLGALHPDYLASPFAVALEAAGHTAREGLGGYDGVQPRGFELALRSSQFTALEWWLARAPELANRVPPTQGNQLSWVPLARVITPKFLTRQDTQEEMVEFLMAHGANPWQKLPYDSGTSVVQYARTLRSPLVSVLDQSARPAVPTVMARTVGPAGPSE